MQPLILIQVLYIARNCDWFIALLAPVVVGPGNYFGTGFSKIIKNCSKTYDHAKSQLRVWLVHTKQVDKQWWLTGGKQVD